ncbi:septum formation family protein [Gulosibacter sp. 10]|uniref:septum formation family protein n=1 Tax=Gulosibacter sp. 10 TaxID=1255570 RepID=UPI00097F31EA|nr:septum formation family protein [Gulosibacter sp. 10]SJM60112.1 hypothetical protein FM112_06930 [Gulosibacter sp. 10]
MTSTRRVLGALAAFAASALVLSGCSTSDGAPETRETRGAQIESQGDGSLGGLGNASGDSSGSEADADGDAEGGFQSPEEQSVFDLTVGSCITEASMAGTEHQSLYTVPCSQPHTFEVFHEFTIDDLEKFDKTEVEEKSKSGCTGTAFKNFNGKAWINSALGVTYLMPTQGSWDQGDRLVTCMVYEENSGDVSTGSLEGAKL